MRLLSDPEPQYCPPPLAYTPTDAVVRVTYGSNASLSLDGISWHRGKLDDAGGTPLVPGP